MKTNIYRYNKYFKLSIPLFFLWWIFDAEIKRYKRINKSIHTANISRIKVSQMELLYIFRKTHFARASTQSSLKTLIASNIYCSIWSIHSIYAISIVVHRNFATTTHWFDLKRQMSHAASFSLFNGWILWNTCRFIRDSCYLLFNYRYILLWLLHIYIYIYLGPNLNRSIQY